MPRIRIFEPAGEGDTEGHIARPGRLEPVGEAEVELEVEGHTLKFRPGAGAEGHAAKWRGVELANEVIEVTEEDGRRRFFVLLDSVDDAEGHRTSLHQLGVTFD